MTKYYTLAISLATWELVNALVDQKKAPGNLQTFNNCREQGLVYIDYVSKKVIWVYAHRNSDRPTVISATTDNFSNMNNMFDDEAWKKAKSFDTVHQAARFIVDELEGGH